VRLSLEQATITLTFATIAKRTAYRQFIARSNVLHHLFTPSENKRRCLAHNLMPCV
jgi:hypothetical protein